MAIGAVAVVMVLLLAVVPVSTPHFETGEFNLGLPCQVVLVAFSIRGCAQNESWPNPGTVQFSWDTLPIYAVPPFQLKVTCAANSTLMYSSIGGEGQGAFNAVAREIYVFSLSDSEAGMIQVAWNETFTTSAPILAI
jgi:hypothetical protein